MEKKLNLQEIILRPLTRNEFDMAVQWAADEGWNPGLHDADIFWATDSRGFVGAEYEGRLIGTGSIVAYGREFGFMGFFIIAPELRGSGIGTKLWYYRRDLLLSRLDKHKSIGMDGVFNMQSWYAKGGFKFSHRNLRMEGLGKACAPNPEIVQLELIPPTELYAYDLPRFGCERRQFLDAWIRMPQGDALGYVNNGRLQGYGVVRKCQTGAKIGPLFADNPAIAESLYLALADSAVDLPLWLDVPEINDAAMALASRHGMKEVFGCARMYYGEPPSQDWNSIYGITTFELG